MTAVIVVTALAVAGIIAMMCRLHQLDNKETP